MVAPLIFLLVATPLVDLPTSTQPVTPDNLQLRLTLHEFTTVNLTCRAGQWPAGADLVLTNHQLTGTITLTGKGVTNRCALTGQVTFRLPDTMPNAAGPPVEGLQFWKTFAEAQGVVGTVTGTWQTATASNILTGTAHLIPLPGRWDMGVAANGLQLAFDMGRRRENWNHARLAQYELPAPRDLTGHRGLRVRVTTDEPRTNASVTVWLREADGSWYYVKDAVPLVAATNEATLLFEDFAEAEWVAPGNHMDEDYTLDLRAISHVGIGVVNPLGIGPVHFTVTGIDTVAFAPAPQPSAQLTVTGKLLSVNGHDRVPAGIFGGYAGYLPQEVRPGCQRDLAIKFAPPTTGPRTEEFYVECYADRYAAPTLLTDPHWHASLARTGSNIAARVRDTGFPMHFEFWNEPYLNWAERTRVALKNKFYDTNTAVAGGPVRTVAGLTIPHFQWVNDGAGSLKVIDETAFSYWSGAGLGWVYDQMLAAIGPAIKTVKPDLPVVAGWGFRWNEDHWAAWDLLYKPTIDRNIAWIDGIHEHHYQGDTTAMNGSYEVLTAYAVTAHRKWLYAYNTECNDLVDAPARGAVDTPEKAKAASKYRKMTYNLRDCLYSVAQSPDKLRARTVIHNDGGATNGWTQVGYGLMRDLRGQLVQTESDDPNVWCVASLDNVTTSLVVCVFNDYRQPRTFDLTLPVTLPATIEQPIVNPDTFELRLDRQPVAATNHFQVTLPARSAWKIAVPLPAPLPATPTVARTQYFSADILRAGGFSTTIQLDRETLRQSSRAWLRLVVENLSEGEGAVVVAGQELRLPKALTADNVNRILDLPLSLAGLAPTVPITFRILAGNQAGYRVDMTSIVLEHPAVVRPPKKSSGHVAPVGGWGGRDWLLLLLAVALLVRLLRRR